MFLGFLSGELYVDSFESFPVWPEGRRWPPGTLLQPGIFVFEDDSDGGFRFLMRRSLEVLSGYGLKYTPCSNNLFNSGCSIIEKQLFEQALLTRVLPLFALLYKNVKS
jgi:hypothetical protein